MISDKKAFTSEAQAPEICQYAIGRERALAIRMEFGERLWHSNREYIFAVNAVVPCARFQDVCLSISYSHKQNKPQIVKAESTK